MSAFGKLYLIDFEITAAAPAAAAAAIALLQ